MKSKIYLLAILLLAACTNSGQAGICSYDRDATSVPGRGGRMSISLTMKDESCTLSILPSGWIEGAVTMTAEAGETVDFEFSALANLGPGTRTATLLVRGQKSGKSRNITLTQADGGWLDDANCTYALPACFMFNSVSVKNSSETWTDCAYVSSYTGAADRNKAGGYISLVRDDANAAEAELSRTVKGGQFIASTLGEGDCWLFTLPGVSCAKGTEFDFFTTICSEAKAPKYYVCEYYDSGRWCCDEQALYTAEEDGSLRYSLMTTGTGLTSAAQFTVYDKSFRLSAPLKNGNVYVRLRAVGPYAADGSILDLTTTENAGASFAKTHSVAGYVSVLGAKKASRKLRVLCIGNSFSYYYHTACQLKQIAYSEGIELEINAFFKGGQTLRQQLGLSHSVHTVALGGYDYAFIQDQSQNPAFYAQSPSMYADVDAACGELVGLIKEYSPQCRVILERTWAYPGNSNGGFASYEEFDRLLGQGTATLAGNAGVAVSPIGDAFTKVRNERPSVKLLYNDDKHPALDGAYLKSCVNYLILSGRRFTENVSDCETDPELAAYLRKTAESVVFGDYRKTQDPSVPIVR